MFIYAYVRTIRKKQLYRLEKVLSGTVHACPVTACRMCGSRAKEKKQVLYFQVVLCATP